MNDHPLLFPEAAAPSPREAWMKQHGIITRYSIIHNDWIAGLRRMQMDWPEGSTCAEDILLWETAYNGDERVGCGATEAEAIAQLCKKWGIPPLNEIQSTT